MPRRRLDSQVVNRQTQGGQSHQGARVHGRGFRRREAGLPYETQGSLPRGGDLEPGLMDEQASAQKWEGTALSAAGTVGLKHGGGKRAAGTPWDRSSQEPWAAKSLRRRHHKHRHTRSPGLALMTTATPGQGGGPRRRATAIWAKLGGSEFNVSGSEKSRSPDTGWGGVESGSQPGCLADPYLGLLKWRRLCPTLALLSREVPLLGATRDSSIAPTTLVQGPAP